MDGKQCYTLFWLFGVRGPLKSWITLIQPFYCVEIWGSHSIPFHLTLFIPLLCWFMSNIRFYLSASLSGAIKYLTSSLPSSLPSSLHSSFLQAQIAACLCSDKCFCVSLPSPISPASRFWWRTSGFLLLDVNDSFYPLPVCCSSNFWSHPLLHWKHNKDELTKKGGTIERGRKEQIKIFGNSKRRIVAVHCVCVLFAL